MERDFYKAIAYPYGRGIKDDLDLTRELLKNCPNAAIVNPDWFKENLKDEEGAE